MKTNEELGIITKELYDDLINCITSRYDNKKLEVVKGRQVEYDEYEVWFDYKKLISSYRKNKNLYRLLSIKAIED